MTRTCWLATSTEGLPLEPCLGVPHLSTSQAASCGPSVCRRPLSARQPITPRSPSARLWLEPSTVHARERVCRQTWKASKIFLSATTSPDRLSTAFHTIPYACAPERAAGHTPCHVRLRAKTAARLCTGPPSEQPTSCRARPSDLARAPEHHLPPYPASAARRTCAARACRSPRSCLRRACLETSCLRANFWGLPLCSDSDWSAEWRGGHHSVGLRQAFNI